MHSATPFIIQHIADFKEEHKGQQLKVETK